MYTHPAPILPPPPPPAPPSHLSSHSHFRPQPAYSHMTSMLPTLDCFMESRKSSSTSSAGSAR